MYQAMVFYPNEFGSFNVRALNVKPVKDYYRLKLRLIKSQHEGYIKKVGQHQPVFNTVSSGMGV